MHKLSTSGFALIATIVMSSTAMATNMVNFRGEIADRLYALLVELRAPTLANQQNIDIREVSNVSCTFEKDKATCKLKMRGDTLELVDDDANKPAAQMMVYLDGITKKAQFNADKTKVTIQVDSFRCIESYSTGRVIYPIQCQFDANDIKH